LILYNGPASELGAAERFMFTAAQEPHLAWMVDSLIFERQFDSEMEQLRGKLTLIIGMLTKIRESPSLKALLRVVLELGNLTNYDYGQISAQMRVRGKALGFKMESLMKLQDVKSVDRKTNLLQYLVTVLEERSSEALSLPADFADLTIVRHWETMAILAHIDEVTATYKRIRDLQLSQDEGSQVETFRDMQQVFLNRANTELDRLNRLAQLLKESWQRTSEYLGEESNDRKPEELFLILDQFLRSFSDSVRTVRGGRKKIEQSCASNTDDSHSDIATFKIPCAPQPDAESVTSTLSSEYSALTRSESQLSMRSSSSNPSKM
jgi:hypothetical protein